MIFFRITSHSGVPPYLQIVQQVKQALQVGILRKGDRLPTIKEVLEMVAVNPNTVAKAYRELENDGLIRGKPGIGTFVIDLPPGPDAQTQATLAQKLDTWAKEARGLGMNNEAIEALARTVINKGGDNGTGTKGR